MHAHSTHSSTHIQARIKPHNTTTPQHTTQHPTPNTQHITHNTQHTTQTQHITHKHDTQHTTHKLQHNTKPTAHYTTHYTPSTATGLLLTSPPASAQTSSPLRLTHLDDDAVDIDVHVDVIDIDVDVHVDVIDVDVAGPFRCWSVCVVASFSSVKGTPIPPQTTNPAITNAKPPAARDARRVRGRQACVLSLGVIVWNQLSSAQLVWCGVVWCGD